MYHQKVIMPWLPKHWFWKTEVMPFTHACGITGLISARPRLPRTPGAMLPRFLSFFLCHETSTSHDREATGCDKIACNKTSILLQHLQCKMYSLKADYNTHYTFEQPWNVDCAQRTSIGLHSHHNTARCASALHSSQLPCSPIEAPKYTLPNWHYDFGDHWAWTTKQSDEISSYIVYKQFDSTVKPAYNNAGMPSNYHCCYQLLL